MSIPDLASVIATVQTFAKEHPMLMTAIVWPILTGVLNSILRKRTAEERAELRKNYPRYAEFVRIVGALGLDPGKALEALKNLVFGGPKDPPAGGATPLIVGAAVLLVLATGPGCTPETRSVLVDALGRKIQCALENQSLPDKEILAKCLVQKEDAKAVLDAVSMSRAVVADRAIAAANIAKKDAADKCETAGAFKR